MLFAAELLRPRNSPLQGMLKLITDTYDPHSVVGVAALARGVWEWCAVGT